MSGGERNRVRDRKTQRYRDRDATAGGVEVQRSPLDPGPDPRASTPRFLLPIRAGSGSSAGPREEGLAGFSCHPGRPQAPRRGLPTSPGLHCPPLEDPELAREPEPQPSAEPGPSRGDRRGTRGVGPTTTPNSRRRWRGSGARAGERARSRRRLKGERAAKPGW